jgi:hypothetical protein
MAGFGDKPYGLREVKIKPIGGSIVTLPVAQQLTFREMVTSDMLRGDDVIKSVVAFSEGLEWSLEAGGISLEAYAALTGRTAVAAGTTPSRTVTLSAEGGDPFPYLEIYGKALGEEEDDIHCKIFRAKVTALEGRFQNRQFFITTCSGIAVADSSGDTFEFVQNETAADLPSS